MTAAAIGMASVAPSVDPPPEPLPLAVDSVDLLPAPVGDAQVDDLSALFALQSQSRHAGRESNLEEMKRARAERKRLQAELREALREAAEARRKEEKWGNLGRVLGKVARVAAVVGSIAAAVATAGAATPIAALAIAGAALSTAGFVVGETKAFERFPNADKWALGLSLAGAGLSCTAGIVAGATGAAQAADGIQRGATIGSRCATAGSGAATAGSGVTEIPRSNLARHAREREADAEGVDLDAAHQRWLIEQLIQTLEQMEESAAGATESLSKAIETKNDTTFAQATGNQWRA